VDQESRYPKEGFTIDHLKSNNRYHHASRSDAVGGPATATMASVLSSGAHLVSYAWLSGLPIHVPQGDLIGKRLNIHGFWMYYEEYLPKMRAALTEATKVVASGKLTLPVTTTYKPSQIKEAIEHSQRGGKVLLDFNHPN
jgi:NADPH:quinone reductase-like Zn-dependent oxidoreductase